VVRARGKRNQRNRTEEGRDKRQAKLVSGGRIVLDINSDVRRGVGVFEK
jgi:hypothetical protein